MKTNVTGIDHLTVKPEERNAVKKRLSSAAAVAVSLSLAGVLIAPGALAFADGEGAAPAAVQTSPSQGASSASSDAASGATDQPASDPASDSGQAGDPSSDATATDGSDTGAATEGQSYSSSAGAQASSGSQAAPSPSKSSGAASNASSSKSDEGDDEPEYVRGSIGYSSAVAEFVDTIGEDARQIGQERDVYASVMIAQAILESGSGSSMLSREPYYNLFGIKGSYQGNSVTMRTQEVENGKMITIGAAFRAYSSYQESMDDYADLINRTFPYILKSNCDTAYDACDMLSGNYATSTTYGARLQDIIDVYDLTAYDEPLDEDEVAVEEEQMSELDRIKSRMIGRAAAHFGENVSVIPKHNPLAFK